MEKIVMANIKMPILVNNGKLQPMSDYIKIDIEKCNELPKKSEENNISLMDQINNILSQQNDSNNEKLLYETDNNNTISDGNKPTTNSIFVLLDEIQSRRPNKKRQNMSFKNKSNRSILRYTMKNRSSNSNTSDVDHSLQQEVEE
jgi:hypothetical protein